MIKKSREIRILGICDLRMPICDWRKRLEHLRFANADLRLKVGGGEKRTEDGGLRSEGCDRWLAWWAPFRTFRSPTKLFKIIFHYFPPDNMRILYLVVCYKEKSTYCGFILDFCLFLCCNYSGCQVHSSGFRVVSPTPGHIVHIAWDSWWTYERQQLRTICHAWIS